VLGLGLGAVAAVSDQPLAAAIPHMAGQLSLNLQSEDAAEGISAFLARRAPIWKDR
jgi:enoyl-CoA hydratase